MPVQLTFGRTRHYNNLLIYLLSFKHGSLKDIPKGQGSFMIPVIYSDMFIVNVYSAM